MTCLVHQNDMPPDHDIDMPARWGRQALTEMPQHALIGALRVRAAREISGSRAVDTRSVVDTRLDLVAPPTATAEAAEPSDPYFARLVKLVPAEVLALYIAFKVV
jgi:hypothetical protein